MNTNDGGPAFPNVPNGAGDKWDNWDMGMTLRDYFAAQVLSRIAADHDPEIAAENAYAYADAMLVARAQ